MKDLDTLIQKAQQEDKTSAARPTNRSDSDMYNYKGFMIEHVVGGYNILLYGKKHTLYVAGPSGMRFTEDMREARAFRTTEFCERLIDEVIDDHAEWVNALDTKPIQNLIDLVHRAQQQQERVTEEQIRQQQQLQQSQL